MKDFLDKLGLGQYAEAFAANDIGLEVLADLTERDLQELGLSLGHRKRLLKAIAADVEPRTVARAARADRAEHRQLTVMFCDLVGSTALSVRFDPEDLREIIREFQNCCERIIKRFGGNVARYMGDGLLVYFGYPEANEDDPERAVRAGREVVAAVAALSFRPGLKMQTRVGIATGPVVVGDLIGDGAAQEHAVVGETPNLAQRLQSLAVPDSVVVSATTKRLAGHWFEYASLGSHLLKGFDAPVTAWSVLDELRVESRFEARRTPAELLPLVGREAELTGLQALWRSAAAGAGQAVLVVGEAGLGKSRLVVALRESLPPASFTLRYYHGVAQYRETALYPIMNRLEREAGFTRDDDREAKLDKLEALSAAFAVDVAGTASLFATLLSVAHDGRYPALDLSPRLQMEKTFAALEDQLAAQAAGGAVLVVFEDLHWVDPTTLEFLERAIGRLRESPVLFVMTARPEFEPPWPAGTCTRFRLERLRAAETKTLIANISGGKRLPTELVENILDKTDGVPLFTEELTKAMLESGHLVERQDHYALAGELPSLPIPSTLQDSLMARLDRLAAAKEVAQIGAVIGRQFAYELLAAVAPGSTETLISSLDQLVAAELVDCNGAPPSAVYTYRHALIQDAAYSSLLRKERRRLHGRIGEALAGDFAQKLNPRPELLAYHYTRAERAEEAIGYWQQAGDQARSRASHSEAVRHFTASLGLLDRLPVDRQRDQLELRIRIALGINLEASGGYASPQVQQNYARARELCESLGHTTEQVAALLGLNVFHLVRSDHVLACQLAEEAVRLCEQPEGASYSIDALAALGHVLAFLGRIEESRPVLERCVALSRTTMRGTQTPITAQDPAVLSLALLSVVLWTLGYPDQALRRIDDARALADEIGHPINQALIYPYAAELRQLRGETEPARDAAATGMQVAAAHGYDYWHLLSMMHFGIGEGLLGRYEEGATLTAKGIAALESTGARANLSYFLGAAAHVELVAGHADRARTTIESAIRHADTTHETFFQALLYQQRGEIALRLKPSDERAAEADFLAAMQVAKTQRALSLELRAASSLHRLRLAQGRGADSQSVLAQICAAFTEGFDTPDLKAARALLGTGS